MKKLRRAALFVTLPLAVVLVAGYVWYRTSETGERRRYEEKLSSYCAGLLPLEESAVFTGYNTETSLSVDLQHGTGDDVYHRCKVADLYVSVGRIPAEADTAPERVDGILAELGPRSRDFLPVGLGGGWTGHTDLHSTSIVLPCTNKPGYIAVDAESDDSHATPTGARQVAELAAGIARKAARHWSCEAEPGDRIPPLPEPRSSSWPQSASGTCAGLGIPNDDLWVHWVKETPASAAALTERCALGETKARDEVLYWLSADYGLYAQARRAANDDLKPWEEPSGLAPNRAYATASCPGAPDALLTISATEYVHGAKPRFLVDTLTAFAERSVKLHGCTDLELPSAG
ncbi:hypothetical protein [Streptomyces chilikensis]|uniref:Uncharacterized protein n=1 Tax=Streptomyces chilikensis TaxID=1194079 RepID=A0ABV3EJL0_9ACTN